jgi:hypothetical protein
MPSRYLLAVIFFAAACTPQRHVMTNQTTPNPDSAAAPSLAIPFEANPNQTLTYEECIAAYHKLAAAHPAHFKLMAIGSTDSGHPLHVGVLSKDGENDPSHIRATNRRILLINNGIHPGEPEGIDATVMLVRDILENPARQNVLEHLAIVIIPVYNIDGMLNRNSFTRANQDGPEAYGFRGNGRNLDLNRDFVKADSRNARTFNQIFHTWMPDVFIDNHTSNGADYQYTMTLIATQHDKLEEPLGQFLQETMLPYLYGDMAKRGWEMIPYVDGPGETPDSGISGFCDYGRYSTGYAALFNTIGFMPETHMLKPFADRLRSTYAFMESVIKFIDQHHQPLAAARAQGFDTTRHKKEFVLDWVMDTSRRDTLTFKGYAARYKPSEVTGLPRLWYDRTQPYEKQIPYYNYFKPAVTIKAPIAYLVPQAWEHVVHRLEINDVALHRLAADVEIECESYYIQEYKDRAAYEGHYLHSNVKFERRTAKRRFLKGDYVVFMNQNANRYLAETLEPNAPDSFFAWNFFDGVLMQKEYFSAYVFEDLAAEFLRSHPDVKAQLEQKRTEDPAFAADARAQLDWVYRQSPWYEPTHKLYPIGRLLVDPHLPLER